MVRKAVFLDRDGVLNKTIFRMGKPRAPYTLEEFQLCEGVPEAIQQLKQAGFILIVVTNQPDVARGWVSLEMVQAVNERLTELLPVDDVKACFHTEKDNCECRKPRPGMLLSAQNEWGIDMSTSFMVGDRISDIEAGQSAGCTSILISSTPPEGNVSPDYTAPSLLMAAQWMLKR